uniref:Mammalian ependymin-related protein 1 n=1 Tax=Ciona savignyi TaxID=51511 RepID=H2ZDH4_CIOSA
MKLLILSFSALIVFAAAQHCISPDVFESRIISYDHRTGYYAAGWLAYDANTERIRVIEDAYENSTKTHYDTLFAYKEKAEYRINTSTNKCTKLALNEKFIPIGVYPNSTYVGNFILGTLGAPGAGVIVQEWSHKVTTGVWYQMFTDHGCIPVHSMFYGKDSAGMDVHYHHEYMDVSLGVREPEIFDIPKQCL